MKVDQFNLSVLFEGSVVVLQDNQFPPPYLKVRIPMSLPGIKANK